MGNKLELYNGFYDLENLVTITITMPDTDWQALKAAEPRGGRCKFDYVGDRFDWYKTTSVSVSGTKLPKTPATFNGVGVIKKSYCGSFSTTKPSLRLDFGKYVSSNEAGIEGLIGTKALTLNNCKQDSSYIRQPLGYEIFRQAGLPYARCNFTKIVVNGTSMGVYLNLEPVKKRFLQRNFAGNDKGNAYELEFGEDLDPGTVSAGRISFEGFSDFKDQKDLKLAAEKIAAGGLASAKEVVDMDQFIRLLAMEALLKHWDGYAKNRNNTYIYNDTVAVATPGPANVKLKFIPCGIDQILKQDRDFEIGGGGVLAKLVRGDSSWKSKLFGTIRSFADTIFGRNNHDTVLKPFIDRMETLLISAGVTGAASDINVVRKQVQLVKSGAYQLIGAFPSEPFMWLSKSTGECMHASTSDLITSGGPPGGPHQEVYHIPIQPGNTAELWSAVPANSPNSQLKFKNGAYGTWLHCDAVVKSSGGKPNVYAVKADTGPGNMFTAQPTAVASSGMWNASGYWILQSVVMKQFVYFSEADLTPKGRKNVHLIGDSTDKSQATALFLF